MAVYTVLEREQIEMLIKPFGIGPLIDFQGVSEGIENTSYFISTDHSKLATEELTASVQHYVLTVFEELLMAELPFYVELTTTLNRAGLKVPCPLTDYNGEAIQRIAEKPALLFPKAKGIHPSPVSEQQCQIIGEAMAQMHLVGNKLALHSAGNRDSIWLMQTAEQLLEVVDSDERSLINEALNPYLALLESNTELPVGIIHNDLFRDNTLFEGDELSAIIDFYNACNGYLLIDVAISVNDWCSAEDGSMDPLRYDALLNAYAAIRPFEPVEKECWDTILAVCASRFWMSRMLIQRFPKDHHRKGCLMPRKDPEEYKKLLLNHLSQTKMLP